MNNPENTKPLSRTKIVATLGPASEDRATIREMAQQGMDAARLNLSHGSREQHSGFIENIRSISSSLSTPLSIIADTKGPEIRVSPLGEELYLEKNDHVDIIVDPAGKPENNRNILIADSEIFLESVSEEDILLIGDGEIELQTLSVGETKVSCRVLNSGTVTDRKGLNIRGVDIPLPTITDQDKKDIRFAVRQGVDWLAISFVRNPEDINIARKLVKEENETEEEILVIAKIETIKALENIEAIVQEADGIMVARGDLGMATDLEEVPFLQKQIIKLANRYAKPVITATQMLESMIRLPSPTRAEVTDVANAVLDGTDALMLSAETAAGSYPVRTIATMYRISEKAETHNLGLKMGGEEMKTIEGIAPAIGRAACSTAERLNAKAIITSTRSGYTARLISRFRPNVRIVAVTPSRKVYQQLALLWGVNPLLIEVIDNTDEMVDRSIETARNGGYINDGDLVVITAGVPFAVRGTTNLIKVERA